MQAFQIFIVESRAARIRLRKMFESPGASRSYLDDNGLLQTCEEHPIGFPTSWERSSRINTKRLFAVASIIGMAAIGALFSTRNKENGNKQKVSVTQPSAFDGGDEGRGGPCGSYHEAS
jgi:hypothetical protein